jgi:hypothetical protein
MLRWPSASAALKIARAHVLARTAVFFGWESAAEAVVLARVISTACPGERTH